MITLRFTRIALSTLGALVSLVGCAAVLGIEPTDVIDGDGGSSSPDGDVRNDGGTTDGAAAGDGAATGDGGRGSTPAFSVACASSIAVVDPDSFYANAIVVDGAGIFYAVPLDAATSEIWENVAGTSTKITGTPTVEPSVIGMALDAHDLYWTSWNTYNDAGPTSPAHVRAYSRAGHQTVDADLGGTGIGVSEITVTGTRVYFGNWLQANAGLWWLPTEFSSGAAPTLESGGLQSPLHFASDSKDTYYDESTADPTKQDEVSYLSSLGNPNEIDTNLDEVGDLVVGAAGHVYWAQTLDNEIQTHVPDLTTGTTHTFLSTPGVYPQLLAYDGDHQFLYVMDTTTTDKWQLQRVSTTDANPQPVLCVDNLSDASAIQYFNGHVYFSAKSDSGSGLFDLTIN